MTHDYEDGIITLTREDGATIKYERNPETQKAFYSEQEALTYANSASKYWVIPPTQEELKAKEAQEAYEVYETARYEDIDYMGTTFQANEKSQNLIVSVLSAGAVPDGFAWWDKEDNPIPMTYAQLQGLSGTLLMRGQIAFTEYQAVKAV